VQDAELQKLSSSEFQPKQLMLKVHDKLGLTVLTVGVCSQLDCSAWQRQIAEALGASPSTPITPSLAHLTALLGPRTAEEEEGYAREANELADQIPVGKLNIALHALTCRICHLPSKHVEKRQLPVFRFACD